MHHNSYEAKQRNWIKIFWLIQIFWSSARKTLKHRQQTSVTIKYDKGYKVAWQLEKLKKYAWNLQNSNLIYLTLNKQRRNEYIW